MWIKNAYDSEVDKIVVSSSTRRFWFATNYFVSNLKIIGYAKSVGVFLDVVGVDCKSQMQLRVEVKVHIYNLHLLVLARYEFMSSSTFCELCNCFH